MSSSGDSTIWDQIQWVLTTIVGVFLAAYGATLSYIFSELKSLREGQDRLSKEALEHVGKGDDSLWEALTNLRDRLDSLGSKEDISLLREAIEDDREKAAEDRAKLAVVMATKNELSMQLERQTAQLLTAFGRRATRTGGGD